VKLIAPRPSLALLPLVLAWLAAPLVAAPNIILILTDDHGWSQLSGRMDPEFAESGSGYLETPRIERLARDGMRFTSGYSPAPHCTPTRRSILCGTSAARSGTEFPYPEWIPAEHLTIPVALKRTKPAYRCAHFGKWGKLMGSTPEECGYDAGDGMTENGTGGMPKTLGVDGGHDDGPPHFIDNEDPKRTLSVTASSVGFMREQVAAGRPFFVQVSYYAQHLSVVTRESLLEKYRAKGTPDRRYTAAWAAMLEELDRGVGQLLDAVDELGIADETYVVFTADNGGRGAIPGGGDALRPTNHPLTGAKQHLYEGGIRVPFIVRGPGIEAGSICREPVVGYDFLPTFHELAGGDPGRLGAELDGSSLVPLLRARPEEFERRRGGLFFHRPYRGYSAIRRGPHKLMVFWDDDGGIERTELYDLGDGPVEEGNAIDDQPELVRELRDRLLAHLFLVDAERAEEKGP